MARKSVVKSYDTDKGQRSKAPAIAVYIPNGIWGILYPQVLELWKCFHPSYSPLLLIRWGAFQVQFVFCNEPIWLANHSKRSEAMEAPQNSRFYFEFLAFGTPIYVKRSTTFAKAYGFKVRCMEIMLGNTLRTWGTYWE
jgi:hypothetical protein